MSHPATLDRPEAIQVANQIYQDFLDHMAQKRSFEYGFKIKLGIETKQSHLDLFHIFNRRRIEIKLFQNLEVK